MCLELHVLLLDVHGGLELTRPLSELYPFHQAAIVQVWLTCITQSLGHFLQHLLLMPMWSTQCVQWMASECKICLKCFLLIDRCTSIKFGTIATRFLAFPHGRALVSYKKRNSLIRQAFYKSWHNVCVVEIAIKSTINIYFASSRKMNNVQK